MVIDPVTSTQLSLIAVILLFVIAVLGLTDVILYHTVSHGIRQHPGAKGELVFHALRGPTYAFLFGLVPFFEFRGLLSFVLAGVLAIDVFISIADFWLEGESRRFLGGLPSGEYVLHMIMAMVFGAFAVVIIFQLVHWVKLPTEFRYIGTEMPFLVRLLFPTMAVLVLASGIQDGVAALRLVGASTPGEEPRAVARDCLSRHLFFTADPQWRQKIFQTGFLIFIPFLGWPMLLGYRKHVITRLWKRDSNLLPPLSGNIRNLLADGLKCCAIMWVFIFPSLVILLVIIRGLGIQTLVAPTPLLLSFFGVTFISPLIVPCVATYLWVVSDPFTTAHFLAVVIPYSLGIFTLPSGFLQISLTDSYWAALNLPSCFALMRRDFQSYIDAWWRSIQASVIGHSVFPFSPWGICWAYLVIIYNFNRLLQGHAANSGVYQDTWFDQFDGDYWQACTIEYRGSLVTVTSPSNRPASPPFMHCTALRIGDLLLPLPRMIERLLLRLSESSPSL